jgi:hypothetical protein
LYQGLASKPALSAVEGSRPPSHHTEGAWGFSLTKTRPPVFRKIKPAAKPRSIPAQPQPSRREGTKIAQAGVPADGSLPVGWRVKPWEPEPSF